MRTIGVISDTHGLLREEALEALSDSALILHAGDVGGPEILDRLAEIAPVFAVRGNTDYGSWASELPLTEVVGIGAGEGASQVLAYVLHDIADLDLEPEAAGLSVVVYGHSHRPAVERKGGVVYFNPGAAGHRRFSLPITVGRIRIGDDGGVTAEVVDLEEGDEA